MHCEHQMKRLIHEYKRILKRRLPRKQCDQRIESLQIRRKDLRSATHQELYQKSTAILNDINLLIHSKNYQPSSYCGLRSFATHLSETLSDHVVNQHEKIINAPQKASKAVVETIQLITIIPIEPLLQKIQDNIHIAIKYGSSDQKNLLIRALNQQGAQLQMLQPLVQQLAS